MLFSESLGLGNRFVGDRGASFEVSIPDLSRGESAVELFDGGAGVTTSFFYPEQGVEMEGLNTIV